MALLWTEGWTRWIPEIQVKTWILWAYEHSNFLPSNLEYSVCPSLSCACCCFYCCIFLSGFQMWFYAYSPSRLFWQFCLVICTMLCLVKMFNYLALYNFGGFDTISTKILCKFISGLVQIHWWNMLIVWMWPILICIKVALKVCLPWKLKNIRNFATKYFCIVIQSCLNRRMIFFSGLRYFTAIQC